MTAPALRKILTAILAPLACALIGAYMLYSLTSVQGAALVVLAVCIALTTPFIAGVTTLKSNLLVIVPIVKDALTSGERRCAPLMSPLAKRAWAMYV